MALRASEEETRGWGGVSGSMGKVAVLDCVCVCVCVDRGGIREGVEIRGLGLEWL